MTRRLALRTTIASAFVVGASLAVFLVLRQNRPATCHGCSLPLSVLVAKVSIAKGTSGEAIGTKGLYSTKLVQERQTAKGALIDPSEVRGEVAIRAIPAGALLTASDFALGGPIYYPRGYPKRVPASQIPAEMSRYLPAQSFASDLEVAEGVWVDGSTSQATLDQHVANGTLIGYCRSIRAFQAHNPKIPFATKCWRN